MDKITHLVFSGGSIRGFTYIGILRYLYIEQLHENIHNIAGTSIGAVFSLIFALKIPIEYIEESYKSITYDKDKMLIEKSSLLDIFYKLGIDDSNIYTDCIKDYIKKRYDLDDITFIELSKKTGVNLYVCAINLYKNEEVIFSVDNTPNISVFDAVRASITIPFYMKPIKIDGEYYVDGGIKNNFPINVFNNVPENNILGVMIKIEHEYKNTIIPKDTDITFIEYFSQLYNLISLEILNNAIDKHINKEQKNIILINQSHKSNWLDVEITNEGVLKKLSDEDIDIFIVQGYTAIYNYAKSLNNQIVLSK